MACQRHSPAHVHAAGDPSIKLSISHALSQSTKLCVFEERVLEIVASTKDLPESLASTGTFQAGLGSLPYLAE
jgi:uncharacterized Rmd1/YagE family protein